MFVPVRKVRKPDLFQEACRLRAEEGMPFKRIAKRLGISVATAHDWTRHIKLDPEQIDRNLYGPTGPQSPEHIAARVETIKRTFRERRREYQREGRRAAQQANAFHQSGCMLYWAEGSKNRNSVSLINSDVHMMRFFRHFLTTCFDVKAESLSISLHVYLGNGLLLREIEDYWLHALELPRTCLRKHMINPLPTSSSGRKKNKLPYGVCTLRLGNTRMVQHIYGAIQEYAEFDEPQWLDGRPRRKAAASAKQ